MDRGDGRDGRERPRVTPAARWEYRVTVVRRRRPVRRRAAHLRRVAETPQREMAAAFSPPIRVLSSYICEAGLMNKKQYDSIVTGSIFLHNFRHLQCTISTVPSGSLGLLFQSCRKVHLERLAPEENPPHTHCHLKSACHASVVSATGTSRSQRVLDVANVMNGVITRSHIQPKQTSQHRRCGGHGALSMHRNNSASQLSSTLAFQCFTYIHRVK